MLNKTIKALSSGFPSGDSPLVAPLIVAFLLEPYFNNPPFTVAPSILSYHHPLLHSHLKTHLLKAYFAAKFSFSVISHKCIPPIYFSDLIFVALINFISPTISFSSSLAICSYSHPTRLGKVGGGSQALKFYFPTEDHQGRTSGF